MKQLFPGFAKRALSFVLAAALLLTLFPAISLTADAAYTTEGWEYFGSYSWLEGRFHSDDADLNFVDDQPYDWKVTIYQGRTTANVTVSATVKDASGTVVASISNKAVTADKGQDSVMLSASDLSNLTTSMFGTFTLTCTIKAGSSKAAELTKTFKRTVSNPIAATVTSRSNPDNVFTFADPIDLVLNIKKLDGVATAYNAAITVTNKSGSELLAARGVALPASTNITLSVKDLVKLPSITAAGTYKVNLTLTDAKGTIQHQSSNEFAVVALENSVTATITSASGSSFTFNNMVPDLVVNLTKNDGVAETLKTTITVTTGTSTVVHTETIRTTTATATVTPDLSGLAESGSFKMTAVITDDAGNLRGSASATFTRTNTTPMTCTLTDNSAIVTGQIYSAAADFNLNLSITHAPSKGQVMTVKVTGTLNGKSYESNTKKATLSNKGIATVKVDGSMLNAYGIFEDIIVEVYNASGEQMWKSTETYSFARVMDTSDPGDLPLLNLNDHFTTKKGDAELKIPLMAQTGANMWRASIPWQYVEKSEGNYAMSPDVKIVMDKTKNTGMQALILLAYGNDDIYGTPNPTDSRWLNAYANYCYYIASMMAQYYPDQVVAFEIWNEWNHASMSKVPATYRTGAHYATVVKAASAKIRAVNAKYGTNFKVIAGATAGDGYGESTSNTFIKAMFAASGFFDAIDGVSFHTYSSEETTTIYDQLKGQRKFEYISPAEHDFAARIVNYKNLMAQYNAPSDLEVWITETGWTTNEEPESGIGSTDGKTHITYGADEVDAAGYLVQLYAWALYDGTIDRIFWYDFMNDISNQTGAWANNLTESNYGLIHNWNNSGDQPLAYSAKAGYVTVCALASKLGGATNGKQIHVNNDANIFAYQFSKDGKYITVMWAEGDAKTVNLTLSKSISISDMYGNATTYAAGSTTLTLTGAPIYLEYASGAISFG